MFDNEIFDSWLNKKSQDILSKVDREKISTEEMLTLILKAQSNHFHHMDLEFRGEFNNIKDEFKSIDLRFKEIDHQFELVNRRFEQVDHQFELVNKRFEQVDKRFEEMENRFEQVDKRFEQVDKRFEKVDEQFAHVDKRFDRLTRLLMAMGAVIVSLFSGLYLKLIF